MVKRRWQFRQFRLCTDPKDVRAGLKQIFAQARAWQLYLQKTETTQASLMDEQTHKMWSIQTREHRSLKRKDLWSQATREGWLRTLSWGREASHGKTDEA